MNHQLQGAREKGAADAARGRTELTERDAGRALRDGTPGSAAFYRNNDLSENASDQDHMGAPTIEPPSYTTPRSYRQCDPNPGRRYLPPDPTIIETSDAALDFWSRTIGIERGRILASVIKVGPLLDRVKQDLGIDGV